MDGKRRAPYEMDEDLSGILHSAIFYMKKLVRNLSTNVRISINTVEFKRV
jgi:hypothetical protein